jgi:hypothetical protein
MFQEKKGTSKGKRRQYSDEELNALGIFKEKDDSKEDETDEISY